MRRSVINLIIILTALPILLPLYNPSLELGGIGIALGVWGLYVSPIIIFGYLAYLYIEHSKQDAHK